jgi:hypothetical protein
MSDKETNNEIYSAISGCRNDAYPNNLYPNWRELFAKHNLTELGVVGECELPDGITWTAGDGAEYKPMPIMYPAIVQYRDDGSYLVKCVGFLRSA